MDLICWIYGIIISQVLPSVWVFVCLFLPLLPAIRILYVYSTFSFVQTKVLNTSFSLCLFLVCPLSAVPVSFPLSSLSLQPADQRMRAVFLRCKYRVLPPSPLLLKLSTSSQMFFSSPSSLHRSSSLSLTLFPRPFPSFPRLASGSADNKSPAVKSESRSGSSSMMDGDHTVFMTSRSVIKTSVLSQQKQAS